MHEYILLLHDPTFRELYHRANDELLGWSEFCQLPMPEGLSAQETWRVLSAMRRLSAHASPYHPYTHEHAPKETWCSIDNRMAVLLRTILTIARDNAEKTTTNMRYPYLKTLARDLTAALTRDAVSINTEAVFSVITRQRKPRTPEEHLATRAADSLLNVERLAKHPLTPWMLEDLYAGFAEVGDLDSRLGMPPQSAYPYSSQSADEIMDTLFKTANNNGGDDGLYLLDILFTSMALWDLVPQPRWNGLTELFVRNWALQRRGLGFVRFAPFSYLCLEWEGGAGAQWGVQHAYFDVNPDIGEEHDATCNFGNALVLIEKSLEQQVALITQEGNSDTPNEIARVHGLNHRQRRTLEDLVRNPTAHITVAAYMQLHAVSYGTARNDLLDMLDKGLLIQEYDSRAMVFRVVPTSHERPRSFS